MGFKRIVVPKAGATSQFKSKQTSRTTSSTQMGFSSQKEGVVECRTLYDALAVGFVNPEVSKSLKGYRKKRSSPAATRHVTGNSKSSYKIDVDDEDMYYAPEDTQDAMDDDYS